MRKSKDIITIGFALFAMFFGAGNLVFPPYLGLISGSSWARGFFGFSIADVGLAVMGILAATKHNGSIDQMTQKTGKTFGTLLGITIVTCLGPLLAIPRTAATTFEVGIAPVLKGSNGLITSLLFFLIVIMLSIKPSGVIDVIGQLLTPALLAALMIIIIKGIATPIGNITETIIPTNVLSNGIAQGYQTMDALGAAALSSIIITSIADRGYKSYKDKFRIITMASIIAATGLILVYGGLAYLGATTSGIFGTDITQTALIVSITNRLLGFPGKVILGVIVTLACITTAIGLTSAAANYYEKLLNGRIHYRTIVIGICSFSMLVSNLGVKTIISFSAPILSLVYPVTIILIIMTFFDRYIINPNTYKGAAYTALLVSLVTVLGGYGLSVPYISFLPLTNIGFNWVIPSIFGAMLGSLILPVRKPRMT